MKTNLVLKQMGPSETLRHHVSDIAEAIDRDFFSDGRETSLSVVVDFPRKRMHSQGRYFTVKMLLKNVGNKAIIHVQKTSRNAVQALHDASHALRRVLAKRRTSKRRFVKSRFSREQEWFSAITTAR